MNRKHHLSLEEQKLLEMLDRSMEKVFCNLVGMKKLEPMAEAMNLTDAFEKRLTLFVKRNKSESHTATIIAIGLGWFVGKYFF